MNNKILFPNCSEIVWKLDVENTTKQKILKALDLEVKTCETDTATFPNGCLEDMIDFLKEAKENGKDLDKVELIFIENRGGGGDDEVVEGCFNIAKKYIKGEITKEKAERLEEKIWGE